MAPLKKVIAIPRSGHASTSFLFVSIRHGQNARSKFWSSSRILSWRFTSEISHPPHEDAQYMLSFGFCSGSGLGTMLNPHLAALVGSFILHQDESFLGALTPSAHVSFKGGA